MKQNSFNLLAQTSLDFNGGNHDFGTFSFCALKQNSFNILIQTSLDFNGGNHDLGTVSFCVLRQNSFNILIQTSLDFNGGNHDFGTFSFGLKCISDHQNHLVNRSGAIRTMPRQQACYTLDANTMRTISKVIHRTHMYKHHAMHDFNSVFVLDMMACLPACLHACHQHHLVD